MPTLTKQIGEGAVMLSTSKVIAKVVSFASYLLILYFLSSEEYGTTVLLFSLMAPFAEIATLGMSNVVVSEIARFVGEHQPGRAKNFIEGYAKASFFVVGLIGLVLIFLRSLLFKKYGIFINEYFLLLFVLFVLQICQSFFSIIFRAHEKFQDAFLMVIIESIAKFLAVIVFVFTIGLSITTVIASYAIAHVVVIIFSSFNFSKTLSYFKSAARIKGSILYEIAKQHGKWEAINTIFMRFINPSVIWSVQIFLGTASVALFSLAMNLYTALSEMLSFGAIFLPIISKRIHDRHLAVFIIQKAKKYLFVLNFLIFLAAFFAGPFFINLFIPKYFDAIPIFQLVLFILFTDVLEFGQSIVLISLRKQKFMFISGIFNKMTKIGLCISLTYFFGLVGTVAGKILTPFIFAIIYEWFLQKWYLFPTISIKSFFTFDKYDKLFLTKIILKTKSLLTTRARI